MLTLVVGRRSNLSRHLSSRLPNSRVVSAREIIDDARWSLPSEPHRLVINSFQPSVALGDLSSPRRYVDLSIGVTSRLLSQIGSSGCKKLVYTSSASVYGDNISCAEDELPSASSLPAALKLSAELLVAGACRDQGIEYTILRLFNMFGGDDNFSVVARLLIAAREGSGLPLYNHGNAIRDFIHIDDVVSVYLRVLNAPSPPIVNVATGVAVPIRDLVSALWASGLRVQLKPEYRNEIRASVADVQLLSSLIDVESFHNVVGFVTNAAKLGQITSGVADVASHSTEEMDVREQSTGH